jgi:NTP pyrophosphatase (non-canonical NTP hydrolase)
MELVALQDRALAVRRRYAALERQRYGREWTDEEIALGFVGDVGDLMKLVQARNGVRAIPDADARLAHELADCLWSVLVLADAYGVDLERAFVTTMDELERHIAMQLRASG